MPTLEERVSLLESQVRGLLNGNGAAESTPWWEMVFGSFAQSEGHEDAMRLGKEWREAQRGDDVARSTWTG